MHLENHSFCEAGYGDIVDYVFKETASRPDDDARPEPDSQSARENTSAVTLQMSRKLAHPGRVGLRQLEISMLLPLSRYCHIIETILLPPRKKSCVVHKACGYTKSQSDEARNAIARLDGMSRQSPIWNT
jgi:hypothetical protein